VKLIASIDVTWADIESLSRDRFLGPALRTLRDVWVGDDVKREVNVRIGSVRMYQRDDGRIELTFVSRIGIPAQKAENPSLHLVKDATLEANKEAILKFVAGKKELDNDEDEGA
jgi:hypothetical protein